MLYISTAVPKIVFLIGILRKRIIVSNVNTYHQFCIFENSNIELCYGFDLLNSCDSWMKPPKLHRRQFENYYFGV